MKRKKRSDTGSIPESLMRAENHKALVLEAWRLKRAWLFGAAVLGHGDQMGPEEFLVPDLIHMTDARLRRYIADLKDDFGELAKHILLEWRVTDLGRVSAWCADQYDAWAKTKCAVFEVGRVHEVEKSIGRLGFRKVMECPPYALFVMQGYFGAAIRHPEYHLASDVALFYNLLFDSEAIWRDAVDGSFAHSSQHSQSLARGVILTCYNLLESFVSGLAAEFLLENSEAPEAVVKKLSDNNSSLRKRFLTFPSLITGSPDLLDESKPPFKELFGDLKQRRDSFVHCEPGPEPTKFGGYIKEQHFHDVEPDLVRKTVESTFEAIGLAWKAVHGMEGPRWLPRRGDDGRFKNVGVALKLAETSVAPSKSSPKTSHP
ncbi:MAG: hypothetical protein Q8Q59_09345 [Luteolibacter sp.]|jgi:hypothetical protein|nr:hypothetical protein [Luteolibacter sp.]